MKHSPLRLERAFFTRVSIQAIPDGNPEAKWEVEAVPQIAQKGDEKRKWSVALKLTLKQIGELKPSYHVEIEAAGSFSVFEKWPDDKIEQLVHVNGSAILYSAIREMVCNLTSRGPWPMLCLPTVTFLDSAPNPVKRDTPHQPD